MGGGSLADRVPGHPKLAIFLSQCRHQNVPSLSSDRLSFIDPTQEDFGFGFDLVDGPIKTGKLVLNETVFRFNEFLTNDK